MLRTGGWYDQWEYPHLKLYYGTAYYGATVVLLTMVLLWYFYSRATNRWMMLKMRVPTVLQVFDYRGATNRWTLWTARVMT